MSSRCGSRSPARSEEGFALVVALLALIGVTALGAAGYLLSNSDYRINQSHRAATNAFYVADAGLDRYMGAGRLRDTMNYGHPAGQAQVFATPLIDVDSLSTLYLIQSSAVHQPPEGGVAQRRTGTVVIQRAAPFALSAALTSPPGLQKNGVSGLVSGFDAANPADCGLSGPQDVAGLMVPPNGLKMNGGGNGKGNGKGNGGGGTPPGFEGNPPIDETNPALKLLQDTGVDWGAMISGGYAEADFVVSQNGYPNFGTDVGPDEWPMVVVDQATFSVNPPQSGRGTLVVLGDLTINGSWTWDGIILVGGHLTSNGKNEVGGAVVTGLNLLLGQTVVEDQLGNGNWEYRYNSCNVIRALKGIGVPVEEPGTWFEAI